MEEFIARVSSAILLSSQILGQSESNTSWTTRCFVHCLNSLTQLLSYPQPSNWSPNCLAFLQSLLVNVNIRASSSHEIIKCATATTMGKPKGEQQWMRKVLSMRQQSFNLFPSIAVDVGDVDFMQPKCVMSDDERLMVETLIR